MKQLLIIALCLYLTACNESGSSPAPIVNSVDAPAINPTPIPTPAIEVTPGPTPIPSPTPDARLTDIAGLYHDSSGAFSIEILQDGSFTATVPGTKCQTDDRYNPIKTTCVQYTYNLSGGLTFRDVPGSNMLLITLTFSSLGQTQYIEYNDTHVYYSGSGAFTTRGYNTSASVDTNIFQTSANCFQVTGLAAVMVSSTSYNQIGFCR